jgi:hypothetical protein
MQIHITRNGSQFDPYDRGGINSYLKDGFLLTTDLAFCSRHAAHKNLATNQFFTRSNGRIRTKV